MYSRNHKSLRSNAINSNYKDEKIICFILCACVCVCSVHGDMRLYYELLFIYLFDHKYCLDSIFCFAIKMWDEQIDRKRDCLLVNRCVMEAAGCFVVGVRSGNNILHHNMRFGWSRKSYFFLFLSIDETISQCSRCKWPVKQTGDRKWWSEHPSCDFTRSAETQVISQVISISDACRQNPFFCEKGCRIESWGDRNVREMSPSSFKNSSNCSVAQTAL